MQVTYFVLRSRCPFQLQYQTGMLQSHLAYQRFHGRRMVLLEHYSILTNIRISILNILIAIIVRKGQPAMELSRHEVQ